VVIMAAGSDRPICFSLFMFTVDMRPDDADYAKVLAGHMRALVEIGYDGFDLPIPARAGVDQRSEIESYARLKQAFDAEGLQGVRFTTNVGATTDFDPTSNDEGERRKALAYLKSRVDITSILGGETVMAGPIVFPYGHYPLLDPETPLWSDALQDWLAPGYERARPVIRELADYAGKKGVKLAIEPVDHWETAAPNMVSDVLDFLKGIDSSEIGLAIDCAHVMLGSSGPAAYARDIEETLAQNRLHYVHISSLDRGSLNDTWIPWRKFLGPILPAYHGPFLVEVFNAIPPFLNALRQTRRKFWIPGEDEPRPGQPSAYDVARDGLAKLQHQIKKLNAA
jgi:sugar phosphate isomerase/epimerase